MVSELDVESELPDEAYLEADQVPVDVLRLDHQLRHLLEEGTGLLRDQNRPSRCQLR